MKDFKFYIIIPAHDEEENIRLTLNSLLQQSHPPKQIIVVNDNSTDRTQNIVEEIASTNNTVLLVNHKSSSDHLPGAKIINAFYAGLEKLDDDYDVICKFDADLIFPNNYLEQLSLHFKNNPKLGMASGFCYVEKNNRWILENLTKKDHIRGALKAYTKACFEEIGQLKRSIGWDTVDELLAKFYGWEILTDPSLKVKHLKPTASKYKAGSYVFQGEALYKMRYGIGLTLITGIKMAFKKRNFGVLWNYLKGYNQSKSNDLDFLVSQEQGKFIRKLRWQGIFKRFV